MTRTILATGGAGYIGSHVAVELIRAGYRVVVLDNFENSDPVVIDRIQTLTGDEIDVVQADVSSTSAVTRALRHFDVDAVIHLAGKKAVGESVANPLMYHRANLGGMTSLLTAMEASGVERLVFSSSATVYGLPEKLPIDETAATGATSPYGRTKLICEEIIEDVSAARPGFSAISLRYFNPVGADPSGLIGESPSGIPNNLFPYVAQTAAGIRGRVQVFGADYDTRDGSGLRDYIHVADLARGHVAAVERLLGTSPGERRHLRINLGTGEGHTVLEVIRAFSVASGVEIPYEIVARRPGDVAASVADPTFAQELLGWRARQSLDKMCRDHWRFQKAEVERSRTGGLRRNGGMASPERNEARI